MEPDETAPFAAEIVPRLGRLSCAQALSAGAQFVLRLLEHGFEHLVVEGDGHAAAPRLILESPPHSTASRIRFLERTNRL